MENKLPEGWEWKKLGDLTEKFVSGGTPPTKNESYWNGTIPWTTSAKINSRFIDSSEKYITDDAVKNSATNIVPKNNVLIATRVGIGKSAVNLIDLAISQDLTGVVLNKSLILPTYLVLYLHSPKLKQNLELSARGSTIRGLTRSDVENIQVPLPPLEIQQKIVSILEKAEETKKLRAQADELTQKLLQSVFLEMFGDPVKNPKKWDEGDLETLLEEDPQNGLYKPSTDYGEGTPILRIDSFYDGKINNIEKLKRLNCTPEEIKKYGLNIGEVLINRVNSLEYLGKCGLVERLFEPTVFESNMMRLKTKVSKVNPEYLTSFLCTQYIKNQILQKAKKAVNQASINQSDVKSLKILIPPIELQHNYSHIIKQIENTTESQKQSSLEINSLFDALMQKAFTGKLVS